MAVSLNYDNEVMAKLAHYSTVLILKMLLVGLLTSGVRVIKGIYINPEDLKAFHMEKDPEKKKLILNDNRVERVRRNHLNDLENIPAFIFLGLLYTLTNPDPITALWHFRIFTLCRIVHTISYQLGVQPWRALCHIAGLGVMASMGLRILQTV